MASLGENIKKARIKKGMTQEELAIALNTTKAAISRYELNKRRPRDEVVQNMAIILDVGIFELFFGTTEEELSARIDKASGDYWLELEEMFLPGLTKDLVDVFEKLNEEGQLKAIERVEELTEIPKYKK